MVVCDTWCMHGGVSVVYGGTVSVCMVTHASHMVVTHVSVHGVWWWVSVRCTSACVSAVHGGGVHGDGACVSAVYGTLCQCTRGTCHSVHMVSVQCMVVCQCTVWWWGVSALYGGGVTHALVGAQCTW